jgi:tetraacyldisaccharide 4'-kinase
LLFPLSFIYGIALGIRHFLYDSGILKSQKGRIQTLVVGNLCAGGSGKTPHLLIFSQWIAEQRSIAVLSRGYKRSTAGFQLVEINSAASAVGDEPLLMKRNLPQIPVAVCENRLQGIHRLSELHPETELVLLDDAYQHRQLKPDTSVLLIPYSDLIGTRQLLPAGMQRDLWVRYKKADIIVVTRCPDLYDAQLKQMAKRCLPDFPVDSVYFSQTSNNAVRQFDKSHSIELNAGRFPSCILVSGIAGANRLRAALECKGIQVQHFEYADHYAFTNQDVEKIMRASEEKHPIFTTGKDRVKIETLLEPSMHFRWYELLLELRFDREEDLKKLVLYHVTKHKRGR